MDWYVVVGSAVNGTLRLRKAGGCEFVLADPNASPENYPELGAEITVVGTFQSYEEKGDTYYHLADAELE